MNGQEYVNLVVLIQNIEDQLSDVTKNLKILKEGLESVEIKDMGEIE